jgi:hypothetical protein
MALQQNLYIDQGTKFSTLITLYQNDGTSPLNLTGATFASQMRRSHLSTTAYTFTCSIYGNAADGGLLLELTDVTTGTIKAGRYLYDVEMVLNGIKTRPIEGIVIVSPQITQV